MAGHCPKRQRPGGRHWGGGGRRPPPALPYPSMLLRPALSHAPPPPTPPLVLPHSVPCGLQHCCVPLSLFVFFLNSAIIIAPPPPPLPRRHRCGPDRNSRFACTPAAFPSPTGHARDVLDRPTAMGTDPPPQTRISRWEQRNLQKDKLVWAIVGTRTFRLRPPLLSSPPPPLLFYRIPGSGLFAHSRWGTVGCGLGSGEHVHDQDMQTHAQREGSGLRGVAGGVGDRDAGAKGLQEGAPPASDPFAPRISPPPSTRRPDAASRGAVSVQTSLKPRLGGTGRQTGTGSLCLLGDSRVGGGDASLRLLTRMACIPVPHPHHRPPRQCQSVRCPGGGLAGPRGVACAGPLTSVLNALPHRASATTPPQWSPSRSGFVATPMGLERSHSSALLCACGSADRGESNAGWRSRWGL